jgi:hypothetical protein
MVADAAVGRVTRALGRRLTTSAKLRVALEARSRVRWRAQLAELLNPDSAGIHSVLEYRYVRDVERPHRFPAATRQAPSRLGGRKLSPAAAIEAALASVRAPRPTRPGQHTARRRHTPIRPGSRPAHAARGPPKSRAGQT